MRTELTLAPSCDRHSLSIMAVMHELLQAMHVGAFHAAALHLAIRALHTISNNLIALCLHAGRMLTSGKLMICCTP